MNPHAARARASERGFIGSLLLVITLFLAALAAYAWVGMGIFTSERWPIRWLEVNGAFQRVSAEQLRASLASEIGASFFTLDMRGLQESALRIPWVSAVKVQKHWPDTVQVTVEEFVPVAHWNRGQLISRRGQPFNVPEADELQGLPWLQGPEPRLDEVLETWAVLDQLLVPHGLEIVAIRLDDRGAWSMVLESGTRLQIGRGSTVERMRRLLASWDLLMQEREAPPLEIDLRYTNGFAVLWPRAREPQVAARM